MARLVKAGLHAGTPGWRVAGQRTSGLALFAGFALNIGMPGGEAEIGKRALNCARSGLDTDALFAAPVDLFPSGIRRHLSEANSTLAPCTGGLSILR